MAYIHRNFESFMDFERLFIVTDSETVIKYITMKTRPSSQCMQNELKTVNNYIKFLFDVMRVRVVIQHIAAHQKDENGNEVRNESFEVDELAKKYAKPYMDDSTTAEKFNFLGMSALKKTIKKDIDAFDTSQLYKYFNEKRNNDKCDLYAK